MEIDAAISLWAEHTDKVTKKLDKLAPPAKPVWKPLIVANTPSTLLTQTLILPQSPAAGRMWFVHRIGVFGPDGHTAAAGVADIYAGPGQEVDPAAQLYSGLTIPTIIVEGMQTNPVLPNERLYAIFYNLTANQQLQFAVLAEEYPMDAQMATRIG